MKRRLPPKVVFNLPVAPDVLYTVLIPMATLKASLEANCDWRTQRQADRNKHEPCKRSWCPTIKPCKFWFKHIFLTLFFSFLFFFKLQFLLFNFLLKFLYSKTLYWSVMKMSSFMYARTCAMPRTLYSSCGILFPVSTYFRFNIICCVVVKVKGLQNNSGNNCNSLVHLHSSSYLR